MKQIIIKILKNHIKIPNLDNHIEIPPDQKLGDYSFPCFVLAKELKKAPNIIAQDLALKINKKLPKEIEHVQAQGPYLNFFVNKTHLSEQVISKILKEKEKYGKSPRGKSRKIMIEFSQANTHKAFHVGHIRGTSLGESLARILEFNNAKVLRVNYQGDSGMHVAKWIWCYKKYHSKEKLTNDESWIASIYVDSVKRLTQNPDLEKEAQVINKKLEESKDKLLNELWKKTRKLSLEAFETIYKDLGTHFDKYFFEKDMEIPGKKIAQELLKNKIAKVNKGATIIDLNEHDLGVWVLLRSDGTVLYSAKDLALARKKFQDFKINESLILLGTAQALHAQQIKKTLELMKFKYWDKYNAQTFDEVRLPTGKMSSRTGENILYSAFKQEMLEYARKEIKSRSPELKEKEIEDRALAISIAAMKYSMLKQGHNKNIVFIKEEALAFEGDTGPYIQYSYARASSILRKIKKQVKKTKLQNLNDHEALLIKKLADFPEIVEKAYSGLNPAIIANYTYQLAQLFNEFYHSSPVINSDNESFRLDLVKSFRFTIKNSLSLLGIDVLEEM